MRRILSKAAGLSLSGANETMTENPDKKDKPEPSRTGHRTTLVPGKSRLRDGALAKTKTRHFRRVNVPENVPEVL
jgi:hypothetical protein